MEVREPNATAARVRRPVAFVAACAVVAALILPAADSVAVSADENYYPSNWNGKKVYLSPAQHHSGPGARGECQGQVEDDMAYSAAYGAANLPDGLLSRQYKVQIGTTTYVQAVANSNSWGADIHLIMHSNAGSGAGTCATRPASTRGTTVIYWDTSAQGATLSQNIVNEVGPYSPGTHDFKCKNSDPCTAIYPLYELHATNATAAYSETEFHDWNQGIAFLTSAGTWKTQFGVAVDQTLGYPR